MNVRLFLLGSALGILCHQRGLLPLHANAVVARGGAYAFAGVSGAGKSTLAAHFARASYPILCDDVCAVSFDEREMPLAWPGLRRIKLWADAAEAFGHDKAELARVAEGLDKYQVPLGSAEAVSAVPLRRLYLLERAERRTDTSIERIQGVEAVRAAMSQTYRDIYLKGLGLEAQNFHQCAALVREIEVYRVRRAWGYDVFEREAARIEQHIAD